jgi:hypothetical protein
MYDAVFITEALKHSINCPPEIWQAPSLFSFYRCSTGDLAKKYLIQWFEESTETKEQHTSLAERAKRKVLDDFIRVDLNAPDAVLLTAFKKWLKTNRGDTPQYQGRNFSAAVLHRWALNQILPYIDLTYWAELEGVQIPHWLMGEALFPGNNQGDKADRIRKTTEKTAKKVMATSCLYSMAAQLKYKTGKSLNIDILTNPSRMEIKNKIFVPPKK